MIQSFFAVEKEFDKLTPQEGGAIICMLIEKMAAKNGMPAHQYAAKLAGLVAIVTKSNGSAYAPRQEA